MENEVIRCMETRRSVRAFKPDAMPSDELLAKVAEAGTYAPTGRGLQSPQIVVVTDKATRDRLSHLNAEVFGTDTDPFYGAPAIIVVLAKRDVPTHLYDGSLVMGNIMNAVHSLGLSSCWIHRAKEVMDSDEGRQMLRQWGVEGDYEGIGNVAIGYAAKEPQAAKPRREGYVKWVK